MTVLAVGCVSRVQLRVDSVLALFVSLLHPRDFLLQVAPSDVTGFVPTVACFRSFCSGPSLATLGGGGDGDRAAPAALIGAGDSPYSGRSRGHVPRIPTAIKGGGSCKGIEDRNGCPVSAQ